MTAFLGSDQGAALVVCSLAAARRAGVADRAVFVWSGAEAVDVRFPACPPRPRVARRRSPPPGGRCSAAAPTAAGAPGRDRRHRVLDIYSCFPSAVELAADALGLATDDRRGLPSTGGLPYFGGPGNNYTTHGIATVTDLPPRPTRLGTCRPGSGLATGLGWFVTKHALGRLRLDAAAGWIPPADTSAAQAGIDASAVEVALEVRDPTPCHGGGGHRGP